MGSLGAPELLIILAIVLLLFGSTRLPKMARSLGQASKEFKKGVTDGHAEADETEDEDADADTPAAKSAERSDPPAESADVSADAADAADSKNNGSRAKSSGDKAD